MHIRALTSEIKSKAWVLVTLLGVVAFAVLAYWPTWQSLHNVWAMLDQSYSHGYLIALVVLYWLFKAVLQYQASPKPSYVAVLGIIALGGLWLFGEATQTLLLAQLALPCLLWFSIFAILGPRFAVSVVPLLLIFIFAIPLWDILTPILRGITTYVVQFGVSILGIPAYFDGFKIEVPAGVIEIASSCAGLNYFLMANAFAAIYSYQNQLDAKRTILCALVATAIALVGNWVRVYILVLVGYYSNMTHSLMHSHANFGWILFGVCMVPMLYVFGRIYATSTQAQSAADEPSPSKTQVDLPSKAFITSVLLVCFCLALAPATLHWNSAKGDVASYEVSTINGAKLSQYSAVAWRPAFKGYDAHYSWLGPVAGLQAQLQVLLYAQQAQGKELIYYDNLLAPAHNLKKLGDFNANGNMPLAMAVVNSGGQQRLLIWSYNLGGKYTTSPISAKLLQFLSLFNQQPYAALVVLVFDCQTNCTQEQAVINASPSEIDVIFSQLNIKALAPSNKWK